MSRVDARVHIHACESQTDIKLSCSVIIRIVAKVSLRTRTCMHTLMHRHVCR
jgi:hypothetical protein